MGAHHKIDLTLDGHYPVEVWHIGDLQAGGRGANKRAFERVVAHIKKRAQENPATFIVIQGDMLDAIIATDKRYDERYADPDFMGHPQKSALTLAMEYVADILLPVRHLIVQWLSGNHEESITKTGIVDPALLVAENLGIQRVFAGYEGTLTIRLTRRAGNQRRVFRELNHHGAFGGRTLGGLLNRLLEYANDFEGIDVFTWGHSHQCLVAPAPPRLALARCRGGFAWKEVTRWLVSTGSFMEGRPATSPTTYADSYASKKGNRPTVLGCAKVSILLRHGKDTTQWFLSAQAIPESALFGL